jgi:hypothetical protein
LMANYPERLSSFDLRLSSARSSAPDPTLPCKIAGRTTRRCKTRMFVAGPTRRLLNPRLPPKTWYRVEQNCEKGAVGIVISVDHFSCPSLRVCANQ